ncbi:MAG: signal peptidase I [Bacilli bacterium]|nr:signal peptidase I [Bacilli bacterium]
MAIATVIGILSIIAMWKIFTKAGKPGWASIIPIYNIIVLFQLVGLTPWLLLLYFIPIINVIAAIVLMIMVSIRLAKAFGKSSGFTVGLIFLNTIFILILGLGDSKYVGIPE